MKKPYTIESSIAASTIWWMLAGIAVVAWGFSFFELSAFSLSKLVTLAVSIFFATLVCRYEIKIPFTHSTFRPKALLAFWGIIWLGLSGGVILGTAASIAAIGLRTDDREKWLRQIAADAVCVLTAGIAFYLVSGYLGAATTAAAVRTVSSDIILSSIVMAGAYYAAVWLIDYFVWRTQPMAAEPASAEVPANLIANVITVG